MMARMLVGRAPDVERSAIEAESSSMNSGLPSAVLGNRLRLGDLVACLGEQLLGELRARRVGERIERECRVGGKPTAPARPIRQEGRPRERDEEDGNLAHPGGEGLEQVEHARVRPLDVVVEEERRAAQRHRLDEDPGREEQGLTVKDVVLAREPEQDGEVRRVLLCGGRPGELCKRGCELRARLGGVVAVEDRGDLLYLLLERAVWAACSVGCRAAADDPPALSGNELRQLEREARLPDACWPEDGREVRPSFLGHAIPGTREHLELPVPPDHRDGGHRALALGRRRTNRDPRPDRRTLALRQDRLRRAVLDDAAGARKRLFPDEHGADGRGRLESCGSVHDVAGDHGFAVSRTGLELDDRFTGVHGDSDLQSVPLRPVADGERSPHSTLRVVSVGRRRAEDAHHRVADELLHRAAEALQLGADSLVVRRENVPHVLGVELLGLGSESDQVDEEHGHDSPLLPGTPRFRERRTARVAEPRARGVLLAAVRTDRHGEED